MSLGLASWLGRIVGWDAVGCCHLHRSWWKDGLDLSMTACKYMPLWFHLAEGDDGMRGVVSGYFGRLAD